MPAKRSSISACLILSAMLSIACLLSACGARLPELLTQVRVERVKVPQEALACRERPAELAPDATLRDLAALAGDAIDWGADCEDRLGTVAAIVAPPAPVAAPPPAAAPPRAATAWVQPRLGGGPPAARPP